MQYTQWGHVQNSFVQFGEKVLKNTSEALIY